MTTPPMGRPMRWLPRARRRMLPLAVMALSLIAASLVVGPVSRAAAADVTDGLALWYKFDETSGTVVKDSSGRGRDGTLNGAAGWAAGEGLTFNGTDTFVKVPDNVLAGMESITVDMDVYVEPSLAGKYFIYGFGNTDNATGWGNGYLFTTGNGDFGFGASISTGKWDGEKRTAPGHDLPRGTWKHVTYTQTGTVGILYEDGAKVAENKEVSVKPADIGGGRTTFNHIGRSVYRPDSLFKGKIRDFRVYNRAITAAEVGELSLEIATPAVQRDTAALTLGDTSAVTRNLKLPVRGAGKLSTITWASSDPSVVAPDGTVKRPPLGRPDATVTLTATVTQGTAKQSKSFTVTVPRELDDSQKVTQDAAALVVPNVGDARGNLTLPTRGAHGTTITWESDRKDVISTDGVVRRPAAGSESIRVNLIATARLNGASSSRTFEALVPPLPPKQELKGYLFSYFVGQNTADQEQIYLALSRGNEALKFRELNGGQPVLRSTLGDKGVRDPFIIRSPEGDRFYQIATDLQVWGKPGNVWDVVQRQGSKSIMVWESTDLVNWSEPRLVKVSPDTAGNTWAPEAFYDPSIGAYVVFWASKIYPENDPDHTSSTPNKLMYATTRDFHTFSEAKPYITKNSLGREDAVIDTTMIERNGTYYRYTKDETRGEKYSQMIFQQKGDGVVGTFENIGPDGTPVPRTATGGRVFQAEGPAIYKSNKEDKWYLLLDDFGGRGYRAYESTDLDKGEWTESQGAQLPQSAKPRHGTVLPIYQAEYDRLLRRYVPGELVDSIAEVTARTTVGKAPELPTTVAATFADNTTKPVKVTWDEVPASAYAAPGTFTVRGTIAESPTVQARATVTVVAEDKANAGPDASGAEGAAIPLAGTATGEGATGWSLRPGAQADDGATCAFANPGAASTTISCTDDGTYTAELKVGAATDIATVTVTNAAPRIVELQAPGSVGVGAPVTVRATFTDAGGNDSHTCAVDWKDGSTSTGTIAAGACSASHPYAKAGSYDVTVTVTDDDGAKDTKGLRIVVPEPDGVNAGPDVSGAEGTAIALTGSRTGTAALAWSYRAGAGVDDGASCTIADKAAASTTVTCTDDGTYELTLTAGELTDKATVTVINAAPKVGTVTAPGTAQTGQSVTVRAAVTDAGANDKLTCAASWGDGKTSTGKLADGTCSVSHTYAKAGSYDVVVTVTDDDGGSGTATARLVVSTKTAVDAGPDVTGVEGAAIRLAGKVTGAGKPAWSYRARSGVDTGATCKFGNAAAAGTTLTCTDDGSYEVTLAMGTVTDKATVTVTNAAPKIGAVGGPSRQVKPGTSVGVTAAFTDPGSHDRHTCTVDWKDGSTSKGTIAAGKCTASHAYRSGGSYDVAVTIADDDGGSGSRTVRVTVKSSGAGGGVVTVPVVGAQLPLTGFSAVMAVTVGVGLLVLGVVLFRVGRGRRTRSRHAA